jgi:hypothetical protein
MIPMILVMMTLLGSPAQPPANHGRHFELQDTLGPIRRPPQQPQRPNQPRPSDGGGVGACSEEPPNGGPGSCTCIPNAGYNCPDGKPCPPSGLCKE